MQYCSKPFRFLHLDPGGNARLCGWTTHSIGNILESGIHSVWHSEMAERIRDSIRDGSFEYCCKETCPYCSNDSLPDLTEENFHQLVMKKVDDHPPYQPLRSLKLMGSFENIYKATDAPAEFDLAFDKVCNHACPTCRSEIYVPCDTEREAIRRTCEIVKPYLDKADYIDICGSGDVFASPNMMNILENLQSGNHNLIIDMETNGALFDEEHWKRISHLKSYDLRVNITANSFDKETYNYLNGGVKNFEKLKNNLEFVKSLREKGHVKFFIISAVMQDRNFREMPEFTKRSFSEFGADVVNLKPVYHWFQLSEEDYWFKDVANPLHPYHQDYVKMREAPIFQDPRVYLWDRYNVYPPRRHPGYKTETAANLLFKYFGCCDFTKKLEETIKSKGGDKIALYGAGPVAGVLCKILKDTSVDIKFIVDKYSKECESEGVSIVRFLEDFDVESVDTLIVTTVYYWNQIVRDLGIINYSGKVLSLADLLDELDDIE